MFETKNRVTPRISRIRLTREANAPNAGMSASSSMAWPADEYALMAAPPLREDERLADGLQHVVRGEDHEEIEREEERRRGFAATDLADRAEEAGGQAPVAGCGRHDRVGLQRPHHIVVRPARGDGRWSACVDAPCVQGRVPDGTVNAWLA